MAIQTAKQRRFVEEYLVDLNAAQAALRAGYSEKNAFRIGYQLAHKPEIKAAIQAAIKERSDETLVAQYQVVEELLKIAFAEAADYNDTKLKMGSKLKALELLGRHLGMFTDKVEQTGDMTVTVVLDDKIKELAE